MKKEYIEPQVKLLSDIEVVLLDGTGVTGDVDGEPQIDFGGTDEEGTIVPSAKRLNVWDEE
jgi:hypothetical protein